MNREKVYRLIRMVLNTGVVKERATLTSTTAVFRDAIAVHEYSDMDDMGSAMSIVLTRRGLEEELRDRFEKESN